VEKNPGPSSSSSSDGDILTAFIPPVTKRVRNYVNGVADTEEFRDGVWTKTGQVRVDGTKVDATVQILEGNNTGGLMEPGQCFAKLAKTPAKVQGKERKQPSNLPGWQRTDQGDWKLVGAKKLAKREVVDAKKGFFSFVSNILSGTINAWGEPEEELVTLNTTKPEKKHDPSGIIELEGAEDSEPEVCCEKHPKRKHKVREPKADVIDLSAFDSLLSGQADESEAEEIPVVAKPVESAVAKVIAEKIEKQEMQNALHQISTKSLDKEPTVPVAPSIAPAVVVPSVPAYSGPFRAYKLTGCINFFSEKGCKKKKCKYSHLPLKPTKLLGLKCNKFESGECPYGDACGFAHFRVDPNAPKEVCRAFQFTGSCKYGSECIYAHNPSAKTPKPSTNAKTDVPSPAVTPTIVGTTNSVVITEAADVEATPSPAVAPGVTTVEPPVCRAYLRGECGYGEHCKFSHKAVRVGNDEKAPGPKLTDLEAEIKEIRQQDELNGIRASKIPVLQKYPTIAMLPLVGPEKVEKLRQMVLDTMSNEAEVHFNDCGSTSSGISVRPIFHCKNKKILKTKIYRKKHKGKFVRPLEFVVAEMPKSVWPKYVHYSIRQDLIPSVMSFFGCWDDHENINTVELVYVPFARTTAGDSRPVKDRLDPFCDQDILVCQPFIKIRYNTHMTVRYFRSDLPLREKNSDDYHRGAIVDEDLDCISKIESAFEPFLSQTEARSKQWFSRITLSRTSRLLRKTAGIKYDVLSATTGSFAFDVQHLSLFMFNELFSRRLILPPRISITMMVERLIRHYSEESLSNSFAVLKLSGVPVVRQTLDFLVGIHTGDVRTSLPDF
jgi:hypothetical protein